MICCRPAGGDITAIHCKYFGFLAPVVYVRTLFFWMYQCFWPTVDRGRQMKEEAWPGWQVGLGEGLSVSGEQVMGRCRRGGDDQRQWTPQVCAGNAGTLTFSEPQNTPPVTPAPMQRTSEVYTHFPLFWPDCPALGTDGDRQMDGVSGAPPTWADNVGGLAWCCSTQVNTTQDDNVATAIHR